VESASGRGVVNGQLFHFQRVRQLKPFHMSVDSAFTKIDFPCRCMINLTYEYPCVSNKPLVTTLGVYCVRHIESQSHQNISCSLVI
jgi:hypothetical protein